MYRTIVDTRIPSILVSHGKESACSVGDWVQPLGWKDPLEKGMATRSSILAWRIPWTEEPGRSPTVHRVAKSGKHTYLSQNHSTELFSLFFSLISLSDCIFLNIIFSDKAII